MSSNTVKSILWKSGLASLLLLAGGAASAQQQINLTAGPLTALLPDGSAVPMWGYACGASTGGTATCGPLNPRAVPAAGLAQSVWSPVVITIPTGQDLQINLTNNLTPANLGGTTGIPTSITIVGQLGGGLGTPGGYTASPDHTNAQPVTWPVAADPPGAPVTGVGTPPIQGQRVQSFGTQVAPGVGASLCWGPSCPVPTPRLKPGTYLLESGTHPSIQGPMGLYGMLIVTAVPSGATAGTAYPAVGARPAVTYNAEVPLLLSEIDPAQNSAVQAAVATAGFSETHVWSGLSGGCGNPLNADGTPNTGTTAGPTPYGTCYPPAVNYTPLYYLINGAAFDKTIPPTAATNPSLVPTAPATGVTGTVLVRLVNAGLRMHVPSIVGAQTGAAAPGFSLIAEDGNPLPGVARVQSEVFMAAGKTTDVMINAVNVPASTTALPIFDRELSLSANAIARDAGMLAYISVNGAALPAASTGATVQANPDVYNSVISGQTLTVSDPGKGVLANDVNVFGAKVVGTVPGLTLNLDGTFTYTGAPTSFTYCGNGATSGAACATVTLGAAPMEAANLIAMNNITYHANGAFLKIQPPGILSVDSDPAGYPLTVALPVSGMASCANPPAAPCATVDSNGGFVAFAPSAGGTFTFTYHAKNSQGTTSAGLATVTLVFPAAT